MKFTLIPKGSYRDILMSGFLILVIFGTIGYISPGSVIGDAGNLIGLYGWILIIVGAIKWLLRNRV